VGAAGNIGRVCAEILAPRFRRTILIGSGAAGSDTRLSGLAAKLPGAEPAGRPDAVAEADVVVVAVNSVEAPLGPAHFARHAIVCDISVPAALHPATPIARPDLWLISGGIARLPFDEDLEIVGFPLPPGQIYGCAAEGILLGFERSRDVRFTGSLSPDHVRRLREIAKRHGFGLADYKRVVA
jgi:predicted amino acid dehydrogenase